MLTFALLYMTGVLVMFSYDTVNQPKDHGKPILPEKMIWRAYAWPVLFTRWLVNAYHKTQGDKK